jgi:glutathione S-transferase
MVTLNEHPRSPYARKAEIAMREKGLEFETAAVPGLGAGWASENGSTARPSAGLRFSNELS